MMRMIEYLIVLSMIYPAVSITSGTTNCLLGYVHTRSLYKEVFPRIALKADLSNLTVRLSYQFPAKIPEMFRINLF
jgi:hypothetical protein